jgi:hypothetical protein
MSRITKTFEIEGYKKPFTIWELKVKDIISLMSDNSIEEISLESMRGLFGDIFLPMCCDISIEVMEEMVPSEVAIMWDNFKEVNASFFEIARKMGLERIIEKLKVAVLEDFGNIAVLSSKQAMLES